MLQSLPALNEPCPQGLKLLTFDEGTGFGDKMRVILSEIGLLIVPGILSSLAESSTNFDQWDSSFALLLHISFHDLIQRYDQRSKFHTSSSSSKCLSNPLSHSAGALMILGSFALCFQNLSLKSRMNSNTHSTYSSRLESFFSAQGICHHICLAWVEFVESFLLAYRPHICLYSFESQGGGFAILWRNFSLTFGTLTANLEMNGLLLGIMGSSVLTGLNLARIHVGLPFWLTTCPRDTELPSTKIRQL
ncbi:hypothetical protein Tco_1371121 [Tanacetum coccineum]